MITEGLLESIFSFIRSTSSINKMDHYVYSYITYSSYLVNEKILKGYRKDIYERFLSRPPLESKFCINSRALTVLERQVSKFNMNNEKILKKVT